MKYCSHCGAQIDDEAVFCVKCGCSVSSGKTVRTDDAPNAGFAVLGFFLPLVGLILYLVWMDSYPLRAKSAGKGALIGVIVSVALGILSVILYVILMVVVTTTTLGAAGFFGEILCHILL